MSNYHFIVAMDVDTVENLKKIGFTEIPSSSNMHVFINDGKLLFDDSIDVSKVRFTNTLYM